MELNYKSGLALLVITLLFPSLNCIALASSSDSAQLAAEYDSNIELVLPSAKELNLQETSPGKEGLASGIIIIRANVDWELQAMVRPSRMQRNTNTQMKLKNPLKILYSCSNLPAGNSFCPSEMPLSGSYIRHLSGGPGEAVIPIDFRQRFDWTDTPDKYNIKVYFRLLPV